MQRTKLISQGNAIGTRQFIIQEHNIKGTALVPIAAKQLVGKVRLRGCTDLAIVQIIEERAAGAAAVCLGGADKQDTD